ncbi:5-amino-6-(5-phospho-D-ribitylamino)uracil phosphatase YigB [Zhongshania aliphaticivorans]|uniref:5-amino-6-(5-phospho-D-ribitylamino)uracil phosphatase YigB n=1 Tax=Zhongshania aliphaticivorans TaxID=1470434 RepID=A0A5S9PG46_9GAMM|nr:HAD-IA family hydrolase [Zhongshania aliphaticivorans]CAA0103016.1 5-amino-6-(5-phospho-D-ribitylamino)uracil phosphatase YigB [Zhongshania aliphaticivorans]CAA0113778.1 5-amino-6-(5-phospho-D-ribitylamino)uracil phosphatase YigB [Zhongshania aliphaticivorans]
MKSIKLLCFDLDDTLWLSDPVIQRAEVTFYTYLNDVAPALTARFSPEALRSHRLAYLTRYPELKHQVSRWRLASLSDALKISGYSSQSDDIAQKAFSIFIEARQKITLFPHCEKIIEELSKHYMLISLTNGNADLGLQAVSQYFTASYKAEQLNAAKPDPALFLKALSIASCSPEEAIHIGDNIIDDITGAKSAGLLTIQACLKADSPAPHTLADDHFTDWLELPKKIEQLRIR